MLVRFQLQGMYNTLLQQQRRFLECGLDAECVVSSLSSSVLISAHQILNKESDFRGDNDEQQSASTLDEVLEKPDLKRRTYIWEMPPGFLIV